MTSQPFDPVHLEVLFRADRILAGKDRFLHLDFVIMSGSTSIQIYSKRLLRVVFLFHKEGGDIRKLSSYQVESDNDEELDKVLRSMRKLMVLDDLADIKIHD